MFVEVIPLLTLLIVCGVHRMVIIPRKKLKSQIIYALPVVGIVLAVIFVMVYVGPGDFSLLDTRWVKETITYLDSHEISHEVPIFVSDQQMPFWLYSDYNIDLLWPIRKSYLDAYSGEMYVIIHTSVLYMNRFYRVPPANLSDMNFFDKIQTCDEKIIFKDTYLYSCL